MNLQDILNKLVENQFEQVSESTWVKEGKEVLIIDDNNISISTKEKGKIYHATNGVDLEKVNKLID